MLLQIIGGYCLMMAALQAIFLFASANARSKQQKDTESRFRRTFIWISHPMFLGVAAYCFKG